MCGICGIITDPERKVDPALLDRMTDLMQHRGPDERGVWLNPASNVGLGARRLSIIGLANGSQPIANEDGSCILVANGEIYNYEALKSDLTGRGHIFSTDTDIEVILHLYEDRGPDFVEVLNGMFAFAIWDEKRRRLFLARDRLGIKPLFYTRLGDRTIFASEMKSIICDRGVPREIDLQAMHDYFSFDYVPGQQTIFQGIHKVPQGSTVVIEDKKIFTKRYWDMSFHPSVTTEPMEYYEERVRELLAQSVHRRLMSEVPVGVLLSGGMDSSAIAAYMAQQASEKIRTFSIGFEDASFNELPYARMVADHLDTEHHEMVVGAKDVLDVLTSHIEFIDEPYADGAAIPTYYVCKIAREEVTVVLSGEGGDEIFAGYDTHAAYRLASCFRKVPSAIRDHVLRPLISLLPVSEKKISFEFKAKRFIKGVSLPTPEAHLFWRIVLSEIEKKSLYSPELRDRATPETSERIFTRLFDSCPAKDHLNRLLYIDSKVFLPDDLFVKNDRMSMAHSIEARVPMTDPDLVEFMGSVPVGAKMRGLRKKLLLRNAMRGILPAPIVRKKKVGFDMPFGKWLKSELHDFMMDAFRSQKLREANLFDWGFVDGLIEDHNSNRSNNARPLWGLLNFAIWYDAYM